MTGFFELYDSKVEEDDDNATSCLMATWESLNAYRKSYGYKWSMKTFSKSCIYLFEYSYNTNRTDLKAYKIRGVEDLKAYCDGLKAGLEEVKNVIWMG